MKIIIDTQARTLTLLENVSWKELSLLIPSIDIALTSPNAEIVDWQIICSKEETRATFVEDWEKMIEDMRKQQGGTTAPTTPYQDPNYWGVPITCVTTTGDPIVKSPGNTSKDK